jgi:hypothetical protein
MSKIIFTAKEKQVSVYKTSLFHSLEAKAIPVIGLEDP